MAKTIGHGDFPEALLAGSTAHFNVYYDPKLGTNGQAIGEGVLTTCERDYTMIRAYFSGITPSGLPFEIIITALDPSQQGQGGAYQYGCSETTIYCDAKTAPSLDIDHTRFLVVTQVVQVLAAAQDHGWNCGASNGEGLSRVLATSLYPAELDGYTTAAAWLDGGRPDFVNFTAPTDLNSVSNGCAVLFLNYLHYQEGHPWNKIVENGALTLAQTYANLTGDNNINPFDQFYDILAAKFPVGEPSKLTTDNPFPLEGRVPHVRSGQIEIAIRALADTPSNIDRLRFSDYADALADFITSEKTKKPLTIAVDAAWGMGKTTLMDMIQRRLKGQKGKSKRSSPTVWFNAWKYDQEDSLWAALALEILAQIRKQLNMRQRVRFWWKLIWGRLNSNILLQIMLKLLLYIISLLVLGILVFAVAWFFLGNRLIETVKKEVISVVGVLGSLTLLYTFAKDVYPRIIKPFDQKVAQYVRGPNYKDRIGFLAQFQDDFKSIVAAVTEGENVTDVAEGEKWPLVIFIDDLDRCTPVKAVEIIEAINLLLDSEHCVFVIGMDARTVAGSIEAKYKDLKEYLDAGDTPDDLTLGQRFLEKIIQITFRIPRADEEDIKPFIAANLTVLYEIKQSTKPSLVATAQAVQEAKPAMKKVITKSPEEWVQEAEQLIKEKREKEGKSLEEAAQAVQEARKDIPPDAIEQAKKNIYAKSFDDSPDVQRYIYDAAQYLAFNPRKIKRFINIFRLQTLIANRRGLLDKKAIELSLLAKWIVIVTRWPGMVEAMTVDPNFVKHLKEAHKMLETFRQGKLSQRDYQRKIDTYIAGSHVKGLIDATDLMNLLEQMNDSEIEALPNYLYLTQTTIKAPTQ